MARAAPRVRHARRAVVTDGVHSRAQGLAVQIPDDVWMHHILWRREAPAPGDCRGVRVILAGDCGLEMCGGNCGRGTTRVQREILSVIADQWALTKGKAGEWPPCKKEAILLALNIRAVNQSLKRLVEEQMMKMAYGEGAHLVHNPARMTNVFLGLKLEWARASANFLRQSSCVWEHTFDVDCQWWASNRLVEHGIHFTEASMSAARLCELHFQQEVYTSDMKRVYNFSKHVHLSRENYDDDDVKDCASIPAEFVISLVKVLIRFIVFLFEWDRKDKLLWKMAIEALYNLIECIEQYEGNHPDHFAAWIIFFHDIAAKHNTFPLSVLTSLNSSFENVEGKKCLALLLGHMVRKQEEALRFFETGLECRICCDIFRHFFCTKCRWKSTVRYTRSGLKICRVCGEVDCSKCSLGQLCICCRKCRRNRIKCEFWFRNDYSRFLEAGCLDFAIEIAVTCRDYVSRMPPTYPQRSDHFRGRRDHFPRRYVATARDLLDFAMLHSRKHASKRMMAKIHRARLEYEAML